MSAELAISHLQKVFTTGARPAVDNVSFTVAAGRSWCCLAVRLRQDHHAALRRRAGTPHGRGNTHRQHVVSAPQRGILVPPRNRNIGMVFQSYAVWPHMTVRQNVAYPLKNRGISGADMNRKIAGALDLVGLTEYAEPLRRHPVRRPDAARRPGPRRGVRAAIAAPR